jgi:hypothetical protein
VSTMTSMKTWAQNSNVKEIVSGAAGLAASAYVPGLIIKAGSPTMTQKWEKIGVSLGIAIVMGMALSKVAGKDAGKAAFIGGVAGTGLHALNTFIPSLPGLTGQFGSSGQSVRRMIAETIPISPNNSRSDENVQLIRP